MSQNETSFFRVYSVPTIMNTASNFQRNCQVILFVVKGSDQCPKLYDILYIILPIMCHVMSVVVGITV
jgi:hypothetical protein